MWLRDQFGTQLDGPEEAREELRRRAQLAISAGLKAGRDIRHTQVQLCDEAGKVLFQGTLAEAAACDVAVSPLLALLDQHRGTNEPKSVLEMRGKLLREGMDLHRRCLRATAAFADQCGKSATLIAELKALLEMLSVSET